MMPITRGDIEILLDHPGQTDYVVSAFADLTVKDGFRDFVERELRNQARAAAAALAHADAKTALDANIEIIREAFLHGAPASAKGMAVFASAKRGLRHVVPLDFAVANQLVVDEEPFVLPLLERWYGEPTYLVALVDADRAHVFEAYHGTVQEVREIERPDIDAHIERDKPRFTYKKRFAKTQHERLHTVQEDKFLQDVAESLHDHWAAGRFHGLILLGNATTTSAMKTLLHKDLAGAVVAQTPQAMSFKADEIRGDVNRVVERWHAEKDAEFASELHERWKEKHLVADGPTDVLDALQQGRATQIICGRLRNLTGAVCRECAYRFGAPILICPYCNGMCRTNNAVQEILRMALKHKVPVHLFRPGPDADPLAPHGGVAALLKAEANWAPNAEVAEASMGH